LAPPNLTLTLRYTDWWNWESNQPIYPIRENRFLDMREMFLPPFINSLTVQFENLESKVKQLDNVIGEMFTRKDHWVWTRKDGKRLVVEGVSAKERGAVKEWKWAGPTRFGNGLPKYPHHGEGDSMVYVVKELTWKVEKD
jgi:hypothetical protein